MPKITNKKIDAVTPTTKEYIVWDSELKGFGVRVYPSGRKSLFLQYRLDHCTRKLGLGVYPVISADKARKSALRALADLSEGKDPKRQEDKQYDPTVAELCDQYLEEGIEMKKASTAKIDRGRIRSHIVPLLGQRKVSSIRSCDLERFQTDIAKGKTAFDQKNDRLHSRTRVRGGKGTAARTLGLLGGILTFAVKRGYISNNPAKGVRKFADESRDRVLTNDEWRRIGLALQSDRSVDETRKLAIRFLMMTGCRRGEAQSLMWSYVDLENGFLRLPDSKTGAKVVALGNEAIQLLTHMSKTDCQLLVFPGRRGVQMTDLSKSWKKICKQAGVKDCRLHDLRHQFATIGVRNGQGDTLYVVGQLLGHRDAKTTQRYTHLRQSYLQDAATNIGAHINGLLGG